jgi:hypothetical protein
LENSLPINRAIFLAIDVGGEFFGNINSTTNNCRKSKFDHVAMRKIEAHNDLTFLEDKAFLGWDFYTLKVKPVVSKVRQK